MIKLFSILISTLLIFGGCKERNFSHSRLQHKSSADTLDYFVLGKHGEGYGYTLLYLLYSNSSSQLKILKDNFSIAILELPNSEDVKNFSVYAFGEYSEGFTMSTSWGGGSNHFKNIFYFSHKDGEFYLTKVKKEHFTLRTEQIEEKVQILDEPINIKKLHLEQFIY